MDLNSMMRDASLTNLEWLSDPETYIPKDKDNNKKDDLQIAWGMGDIETDYKDTGTIIEQLGLSDPEPNIQTASEKQANEVAKYASGLMMLGYMGKKLQTMLVDKFDKSILKASEAVLKEALTQEGISGCIAVDARYMDSCKEASKFIANSPNKKFIKHIIGCKCGSYHNIAVDDQSEAGIVISSNTTDDFFITDDVSYSVKTKEYCKEIMKPIISGQQDLDDSEMDSTLIDLVTLGQITENEVEEIKKSNKSNLRKVQIAFVFANKKQENKPVVKQIEKSESYKLTAEMDITVDDERKAVESLNVDTVDHSVDQEIKIQNDGRLSSIKNIETSEPELSVEITKANIGHQEVDIVDNKKAMKFEINSKTDGKPMKMDAVKGEIGGFEYNEIKEIEADLDVETVDFNSDQGINLFDEANTDSQEVDSLFQMTYEDVVVDENDEFVSLNVDELNGDLDIAIEPAMTMFDELEQEGVNLNVNLESELKDDLEFDNLNDNMPSFDLSEEIVDMDIDPAGYVGEEFEGTDLVDLDDIVVSETQDVDMSGGFSF